MKRILLIAILAVLLSGCWDRVLLGTPVYLEDEWTIRAAEFAVEDGMCAGRRFNETETRQASFNFSLHRDHASCLRVEAARRVAVGGTYNVTLGGTNQTFELEVDDRARQHTTVLFGETPGSDWVRTQPGSRVLVIVDPIRASPRGSWFSLSWNATSAS